MVEPSSRNALEQYLPKKVLVIEDDQSVQSLIKMSFRDYGIHDVYCFHDGQAGWNELFETKFDLIILDWKLPSLEGKQIFNRLRMTKDFRHIPVIVVSGFLDEDGISLINDFFFSAWLEKPFDDSVLMKVAKEVLRDRFDFGVISKKADELYFESFDHNVSRPMDVLNGWLQNYGQNPKGVSMVADILRNLHAYDQARQIITNSLKVHRSRSLLWHQLGLTQLLMGQYEKAQETFERANEICDQNMERKVILGLLDFHNGQFDRGMVYFDAIRSEDPESPLNRSLIEIINFVRGRFTPAQITQLTNGLGFCLNRLALQSTQLGQYKEGSEFYSIALMFASEREAKAKLYYNLGICEARMGNRVNAMHNFFRSLDLLPNFSITVEALRRFGFEVPYGM
ncbi:MAG: response regulator [Pseudobacteriovorax sp.]|nr:response regulator [Pseudobacteriovorax sp.]